MNQKIMSETLLRNSEKFEFINFEKGASESIKLINKKNFFH